MATEFVIPNVGENVNQVTIVNWFVDDGKPVKTDQEILEAETDKATISIPANASGHLHIGPYQAGDEVEVGTVVAVIGTPEDSFESYTPDTDKGTAEPELPPSSEEAAPSTTNGIKATGVARKMAADLGIDLQTLTGSGEHGRVTKADVQQAAGQSPAEEKKPTPKSDQATTKQPAAKTEPKAKAETQQPADVEVKDRRPLKGIRRTIANRMAESVHTTARVTLVREVDATELVAFREHLKQQYQEAWGFAPGYNELLLFIAANGLREFPFMNVRLSADGEAIEELARVNIGTAVDTERGLLVTVLREADKKGLPEIGQELRALIQRVKEGKSPPEELSGGSFTITNLGMFNVDAFTPVINLPEAAILGVGRIVPKPVVKDDEIVVRKMWTLSLVFDHRLVDGAPAARFLNHICELIEDPNLLFLTKR